MRVKEHRTLFVKDVGVYPSVSGSDETDGPIEDDLVIKDLTCKANIIMTFVVFRTGVTDSILNQSMPLTSLFRNELKLTEKNEASVVRECLMTELEFQIKESQHAVWQREDERKKQQGVADYSWLASAPPKYYAIPQLQVLQLEELCTTVKSTETGRIINRFRELLVREPRVEEIPLLLKAVMDQVIQERPQEETLSEWGC